VSDAASVREVDAWRFTGGFLQKILSRNIPETPNHPPIPWARAAKPLSEARVALLTTAGVSMRGDAPFDMDGERERPTWGDPSWRRVAATATVDQVEVNHLHIDTGYIERDLNVALPVDRLRERVAAGEVGASADTHYSIMGYQGASSAALENESAPEIAEAMLSEEVDYALLAPV
jgi:D-proline reductase (dithiol) PrdB